MPHPFLCTAPGRAGIIGNPTDMYGGTVISCSTRERAAVLIEPSDELTFEVSNHRCVVRSPRDLELDGGYFDVAEDPAYSETVSEHRAMLLEKCLDAERPMLRRWTY